MVWTSSLAIKEGLSHKKLLAEEILIHRYSDYVTHLQRIFRTGSSTLPLRHGPPQIFVPKEFEMFTCNFVSKPHFK
ncbi:hypothetical protein NPIL_317931 [Nephila pilipes]|uniref:Uncharacterized protein n=1 Tax=Nephila pilipes TaxID=299642 RepID=A0A8X6TQY9_NEPPI|nr:hypothetical protein NPIL_317931 [Nephila pilipes]